MWDSVVFYKQLSLGTYVRISKYFTDNVLPKIKESIDRQLAQLLKDVKFDYRYLEYQSFK